MNPDLDRLQPYPFEKLAALKQGIMPPAGKPHIALSIGEPAHATPHLIQEALLTHLHGLSNYPTTKGLPELRHSIAAWRTRFLKQWRTRREKTEYSRQKTESKEWSVGVME